MTFSAVQSVSGTLVASTAAPITFGSGAVPIRYAYVAVNNTGTTVLYVRTDGSAATVGGDLCVAIQPGTTQVVANEAPSWSQAANVIASGTYAGSAPGVGTPQGNTPNGSSPYGGKVSPGTSISLISSGTPTYTVSGTG